ncbi:hypothetical protein GCM10022197_12660 [Microlunatus spumicola]|uniref:Htaa protein n=1 Tax=Microlunatus spumicola TaxID=81499 RepID=A0ABP6X4C9_9ACTN
MPSQSRLHRPLTALVLGAALLAPVQPALTAFAAPPVGHPVASARASVRATALTLTAYGDSDPYGAIHLSGSLRWAGGKSLGHRQQVELWARTGTRWALVKKAQTDRSGDVELRVTPTAHTTYQLRYAGSRSASLSSAARRSVSRNLAVHATAHLTLQAPVTARRGTTFAVSGKVTPGGAGRVVTLAGDGRTFTTLRTRADGTFSGHVRLQQTTTLTVVLADTATLDGARSGPRVVRVSKG